MGSNPAISNGVCFSYSAFVNLLDDLECHFQCPLSIPSRDPGRLPVSYTLQERVNLSLQRVDLCDRNLFGHHLDNVIFFWRVNPFSERGLLSEIINGEGTILQKDSSPPGLLLGDSAYRQICFTSIFKLNPGISDIRVRSEDWNAHGMDLPHLCVH